MKIRKEQEHNCCCGHDHHDHEHDHHHELADMIITTIITKRIRMNPPAVFPAAHRSAVRVTPDPWADRSSHSSADC